MDVVGLNEVAGTAAGGPCLNADGVSDTLGETRALLTKGFLC